MIAITGIIQTHLIPVLDATCQTIIQRQILTTVIQASQQIVLRVTMKLHGYLLPLIMMLCIFQSIAENIMENGIHVQIAIATPVIILFSVASIVMNITIKLVWTTSIEEFPTILIIVMPAIPATQLVEVSTFNQKEKKSIS